MNYSINCNLISLVKFNSENDGVEKTATVWVVGFSRAKCRCSRWSEMRNIFVRENRLCGRLNPEMRPELWLGLKGCFLNKAHNEEKMKKWPSTNCIVSKLLMFIGSLENDIRL